MFIEPHGPAEVVRLRAGDVITALGTITIRDLHQFHDAFTDHRVGQEVSVTVWRRGGQFTVGAVLAEYR